MAKQLLPEFGGGASIWITSLVFFQVTLLLGYAMTHWLIGILGLRRHMALVVGLLLVSLAVLPLGVAAAPITLSSPTYQLLLLLTLSVGLPYLMLSTTSPTLQYWMANDDRMVDVSPYIQYGVSNAGSLLGLLVYPFALEPLLASSEQTGLWSGMYLVYAALIGLSLVRYRQTNRGQSEGVDVTTNVRLGKLKSSWFVQAMIPSALLLAVTHYLTLDVVNLPLLWVAPLTLYLLTFVICFIFPSVSRPRQARTAIGVVSLLLLMVTSRSEMAIDLTIRVGCALLAVFAVAMVIHGDLERDKPDKQHLTGFYLVLAGGGAAGSVLVGLVAPLLFASNFEFYLVVLGGLYYLVSQGPGLGPSVQRLLLPGLLVVVTVAYVLRETSHGGQTIARDRSFYSTYAIRDVGGIRRLVAGTHVHGEQFLDEQRAHIPLAYYHDATGVAQIMQLVSVRRVALVGLGIGSIVEYGTPNMRFDVYELDPVVIRLANQYFTVLPETDARVEFFVGDGRIGLNRQGMSYDLIVMDAFSSGSIPTHLVTLEAVKEILERLTPDGVLAYHISNHYVDLLPVLNAIAVRVGVGIMVHQSAGDDDMHKYPARWVMLTHNDTLLELLRNDVQWAEPGPERTLWRDDASDIQSVLKFSR